MVLCRTCFLQVADLEKMQHTMATDIMAYVRSSPILGERAHSKKLEENPEWALILGLGYNPAQKQGLIYKHMHRLLGHLRQITGGDVMKAKQLGDLLYLRLHAGEETRMYDMETAKNHRHDVNEGIVASIAWFVTALHNAGGGGRYPLKVRQAQQVIATAVSQAAALSMSNTTVKEIGKMLGLDPKLIGKSEKRFRFIVMENGRHSSMMAVRSGVTR